MMNDEDELRSMPLRRAVDERLARLETQMERLLIDIGSEGNALAETAGALASRLDKIEDLMRHHERMLYLGVGGLAVLQVLLIFLK